MLFFRFALSFAAPGSSSLALAFLMLLSGTIILAVRTAIETSRFFLGWHQASLAEHNHFEALRQLGATPVVSSEEIALKEALSIYTPNLRGAEKGTDEVKISFDDLESRAHLGLQNDLVKRLSPDPKK